MIFFVLSPNRKVSLNASSVVLLLFSLSMMIFNPSSHTSYTNIIRPFTYPLCYIMGTNLFARNDNNEICLEREENKVSVIIYVLTAGAMLHFLLNMLTNWDVTTRHVVDFWTKEEASATSQAVLACLMVAVAMAFLFSQVGKTKKIIAIVSLVLIISYNFILAGRTLFALIIIMAIFALVYSCFANKKSLIKSIVIVLTIVAVFALAYKINLFGIKSAFESSNFYDRFIGGKVTQDMEDDVRMEHKMAYIKYFLDYPWGGGNIREIYGHSAHDLYLDTYDESSIFALITIVIYIIQSLRRMIKCFRSKI